MTVTLTQAGTANTVASTAAKELLAAREADILLIGDVGDGRTDARDSGRLSTRNAHPHVGSSDWPTTPPEREETRQATTQAPLLPLGAAVLPAACTYR